jgi:hypothetical protein
MSENDKEAGARTAGKGWPRFSGAQHNYRQFMSLFEGCVSTWHPELMKFFWESVLAQPGISTEDRDLAQGLMESCDETHVLKTLGASTVRKGAGLHEESGEEEEEAEPPASAKKKKKKKAGASEAGAPTAFEADCAAARRKIHMLGASLQQKLFQLIVAAVDITVSEELFGDISALDLRRGSLALEALHTKYGVVEKETATAMLMNGFIKAVGTKDLDGFIELTKHLKQLACDIGNNVPTQPAELLAAIVLALLKGSDNASLVNIATKGLESGAMLGEIHTSLQQIKDFKTITGGGPATNYKGAVQAYMGAATNDDDNDPMQECRKCKAVGKVFVSKKSEWLAHAKMHHPFPFQETSGGQPSERTKIPEGSRKAFTKALFAHIETLPEEVDVFAYAGFVYQIEGDDLITVGRSAAK